MANYGRVKSWSDGEVLEATDLNAEFDNVIVYTKFAGTYTDPLVIGTFRVWHDTINSCLRIKAGAPSTITDGTILMEG